MTQTVLVTGAASGLGNVIARHLLTQGYQVVLTDVDAARAEAAAAELDSNNVLALGLDIRQPHDFDAALNASVARFGSLHALVNNAALTLATPVMDIGVDEFQNFLFYHF